MAYVSTSQVPHIALLERVKDFFAKTGEKMIRHRIYRTTLQELERLDDRDLADLGIRRSEIRRIAWNAGFGNKGEV